MSLTDPIAICVLRDGVRAAVAKYGATPTAEAIGDYLIEFADIYGKTAFDELIEQACDDVQATEPPASPRPMDDQEDPFELSPVEQTRMERRGRLAVARRDARRARQSPATPRPEPMTAPDAGRPQATPRGER